MRSRKPLHAAVCPAHLRLVFVLQTHEEPCPLLFSCYTKCRSLAVPREQLPTGASNTKGNKTPLLATGKYPGLPQLLSAILYGLCPVQRGCEVCHKMLIVKSTPKQHHQAWPVLPIRVARAFLLWLPELHINELLLPRGFCVYRINTKVQYPVVHSALS